MNATHEPATARRSLLRAIAGALAVLIAVAGERAGALESPWLDGYNTRVRLSAGRTPDEPSRLLAFVEIELPPGWKTYWRSPGDAGGLPPTFDWSKSSNLAHAEVLYPAPKLMTDKAGNTIGYTGRVVFPVEIKAANAGEPIGLALKLHYGICKDICVPVESELSLDIPADVADEALTEGLAALDRVPRGEARLRSQDPVLKRAEATLDGPEPRLLIEASFPGGADGATIFLEAPDGLYVPVPKKIKEEGGVASFAADLGADVDLAALRGKTITATLVGKEGASVASFPMGEVLSP